MQWLVQFVVYICVFVAATPQESPVVHTTKGKLRGKIVHSYTGEKIFSFIGVRFAEPPIEENRFKAPVPVRPWDGIKDATVDGPLCPQPGVSEGVKTSEDCLFLNVHTKTLTGKQPVIIHLHSGGFAGGTGNNAYLGPQYLLDKHVVLVTCNYRLGPLGFISTGDAVLPGNYGLKDQLAVMKWVHHNIARFGGDPDNVTLYGYSVGGGSAQLHMLSPLSRGLFHRVISASCSATAPSVLNRDPTTLARRFATILNCSTDTSEQIRDCLMVLPEPAITSALAKIWDTLLPPLSWFGPVVERYGGNDRFLRDDPVKIIQSGQFTQVPLMTGITKDEFAWRAQYVLTNETYLNRLNQEFDEIAPWEFHYPREPKQVSKRISNAFKEFYFHNRPVSNNTETELGQLYADSRIIFPVYQASKLIAEKSSAPVYFYQFNYEGRFSYRYYMGTQIPYGVGHHDDLIYLFYISRRFPLFNQTDPEAYMVRTLTTIYTNFAKTGSPTLPGTEITWLPMTKEHLRHLNISNSLTMEDGLPYPDRMAVWESQLPLSMPYRQSVY